ncbi:MAG TPA: flavodoxin domain-containing protein, partial [Sediminibacterium sp.]|nr:flavodoxin domain-containing protein [Sediminibacterium sp.]
MLEEPKHQLLANLLSGITREELIWINGYIAGIIQQPAKENSDGTGPVKRDAATKLTIVYGTETGNARKLATEFATRAKKLAYPVKLVSLDQYRVTDLHREQNLLVVISTQGDGEPPLAAQKFYDHIHQAGFQLPAIKYAVLALGDSSYPLFCKTGTDVDEQLEKAGAQRILPVCKCDVEYEADAAAWFQQVLNLVGQTTGVSAPKQLISQAPAAVKSNKVLYEGELLSTVNLLDRMNGDRVIQHLEFLAEEVPYEPGDSIGIIPANPADAVQNILDLLQTEPETILRFREQEGTIQQILTTQVQIQYLHERVIARYAAWVGQDIPAVKMDLL